MHFQVIENSNSDKNITLASCADAIITHIGRFLTIQEQIQFATSNTRIKAKVFSGLLDVTYPIKDILSLKQFLSHNPNVTSLTLSILTTYGTKEDISPSNLLVLQEFFPKITNLDLYCSFPDLCWFEGLTKLRTLAVTNCKVNISLCTNFPAITNLKLVNYRKDFSLKLLQSLPLQHLTLEECPLVNVSQLTNLAYLKILLIRRQRCDVLYSLPTCPNLECIMLINVLPIDIGPLHILEQLQEFRYETTIKDYHPTIDLEFLRSCKALTTVILNRVDITSIEALSTCSSLQKVWINKAINLVDISPLTRLPVVKDVSVVSTNLEVLSEATFPSSLTQLELDGKILAGNIRFTSKVKSISFNFKEYKNDFTCLDSPLLQDSLSSLGILSFMLKEPETTYITKLTNLRGICIGGITDTNVSIFNSLTKLHTISIHTSTLTSLEGLKSCVNLRTLYLTNNAQLVYIQALKDIVGIKKIVIDSCRNIHCPEVLNHCANLETLSFNNCGRICITPFKACPKLQKLQLDGRDITSEKLLAHNEGDLLVAEREI